MLLGSMPAKTIDDYLKALPADRREALGVCARARAIQFTPARMAASYIAIYSDLMAANNLLVKN